MVNRKDRGLGASVPDPRIYFLKKRKNNENGIRCRSPALLTQKSAFPSPTGMGLRQKRQNDCTVLIAAGGNCSNFFLRFSDKPAWLDQVSEAKRRLRVLQVTATTNNENSLIRHHFVGHFQINLCNQARCLRTAAFSSSILADFTMYSSEAQVPKSCLYS